MKILVLSNTPWANDNSFGNSFSNIFDGIPDLQFANIYCRYGRPDNQFAMRYFQITEKSLLRNLRNKSVPSGTQVFVRDCSYVELNEKENRQFDNARKVRWQILFWGRDLIWKIGRWDSVQLRMFLDDFQPDIIFQPVYYSNYICDIALFIKKYTKCPMVGYISDDNYTLRCFRFSPLFWIDRFHKRKKVRRVIEECQLLYVITDIQKREYEKIFNVPMKILTKCIDVFSQPLFKSIYKEPLQLVYTGNIGGGRWKTLALIVQAVKKVNKGKCRMELQVYTATPLTRAMKNALQIEGSSYLRGSVSAAEISSIHAQADILVHVEGLDLRSRCEVHQSFSTKIIDYLQAGRAILAVGSKDVASIEYLERNKCAFVAHNRKELNRIILDILNNHQAMECFAHTAFLCAQKDFDRGAIQRMLLTDLWRVINR